MKRQIICVALLFSFLSPSLVIAGQMELSATQAADVRNNTCIPYFRALQNGDVKAIIAHTAGEMYDKYKVLLEQNPTYPQFLRDYYRDVDFRPGNVVRDGNDLIVDVEIIYPNGNHITQKLRLSERVDDFTRWKIVGVVKNF